MTSETNDNIPSNTNTANVEGDNNITVQHASGPVNIHVGNIINKATDDKRPTNMLLSRKLIEAIQDYSPRAKEFLEKKINESEKAIWETKDKYLPIAKRHIISSYVSVLGVFLERIFGSGNTREYFEVSIATVKRSIQLLCYTFISGLWDQPKDNKYQLSGEQNKLLTNFFNSPGELDFIEYVELFKTLVSVFHDNKIEYPFVGFINLENDIINGKVFLTTCENIDAFREKFKKGQNLPTVDEIEKELTSFLVSLNFLANYKMVSVKDIGYEKVRYNPAQYLHAYTPLGVNNDKKSYGQKYNYQDEPINTDAILLFKNSYQEGLNLFPFIIDYNAFTYEKEVRICFYAGNDENIDDNDKKVKFLKYIDIKEISSDTNNDSEVKIEFNEDIEKAIMTKEDKDIITKYKTEPNSTSFYAMKKNGAYKTFEKAKEAIVK